jgi:integrase
LKREAQDLIDAFYERKDAPAGAVTVNDYFRGWLDRHPRSERTDVSYDQRVRYVLEVELGERKFRDWPIVDVRRAQAVDLLDVMLRVQGRAVGGARGVLRVLSAMWQDAIDDGHDIAGNPFMGVKVRSNDRRVQKATKLTRIWTWDQMHALCAAAALPVQHDPARLAPELRESMIKRWRLMNRWRAVYGEPMLRTFAGTGARLGEVLPLERGDLKLGDGLCGEQGCTMEGPHLHVRKTTWRLKVTDGTKTDHGEADAGRVTPLGPSLVSLLAGLPPRIDTRLLFPTVTGSLFSDGNFYRDVWRPAAATSGVPATPHEFRHSYVSLMRAAGVDPADLAAWTGHTVLTATTRYVHSTGGSLGMAREALG